jgi:alpha-glucuronidase
MLPNESGLDGWLRYAALPEHIRLTFHETFSTIIALSSEPTSPVYTAGQELQQGISKILGLQLEVHSSLDKAPSDSIIVVGTVDSLAATGRDTSQVPPLQREGFFIDTRCSKVLILGQDERGAIYGAFEFLSKLAQGDFAPVTKAFNPSSPIRFVNLWDNLDGTIERGYAGKSILWKDGFARTDMDDRIKQFAKLLSSTRVNGCVVNNVNAGPDQLSTANMKGLKRIADIMRPYGVRVGICVFFDSPTVLGGLPTSDPLDPHVQQWWTDKFNDIFEYVPDFMGVTYKGDSEGQPGPLKWGRTIPDGANMFARALKRHTDAWVMVRAFVYDKIQVDDAKRDRAMAAVDHFRPMDGQFDDNVVVQIKWGPIDFQVREPVSPLFANLKRTNMAIEWQHCQEYMGQQTHTVYMAPLFRKILDFDMRVDGKPSRVADIIHCAPGSGKVSGSTTVLNIGEDRTWMGHHLAMANFYSFGRLAWNTFDDPTEVARDWIRLTFGTNPKVMTIVAKILAESWPAYEGYTGNLGMQTLVSSAGSYSPTGGFDPKATKGGSHFGPDPAYADSPRNHGGHYTRAGKDAIGVDRTVKTGSGFAGQYPAEVAAIYEDLETCPDELLLWFHHVPWTHQLRSGKTVIQHIYDSHYQGSEVVRAWLKEWEGLKGLVDDDRFRQVAFKLRFQADHSLVWRDAVTGYFFSKSGLIDEHGRVGNHPYRIEAEDMELDGYNIIDVVPVETASGGKAVATTNGGSVKTVIDFDSGVYDIAVNYYDHEGGKSQWELFINERSIGEWTGDMEDVMLHKTSGGINGCSATRITFNGVSVNKGDVLKITGQPDGIEQAPLDYVSLLPAGIVD